MKLKYLNKGKVLTIFGLIISVIVIVLAFLQVFNVWNNAIYVYEPLVGVLMIIKAIEFWKTNKSIAFFLLFVAIFTFIVSIFIFVVKIKINYNL